MKLSQHKISNVLNVQKPKRVSAIAGGASGHMKLTCYAVKVLNDNDITASYENICAAMWRMFPKVEKFHLYGFDDIPNIDEMEKCIKLRGLSSYKVLSGGNTSDKKINEPFSLTQKGALWAKEAEAILTGKIPRLKEWAYAGFAINFLGATASHILADDSANAIFPFLFFLVLMASYALWYKTSATPTPFRSHA